MGKFAVNAIVSVAIAAAIAVPVNTDALFIPAFDIIEGFTAKIYAIAKKVVIPATVSRRIFVP